MGYFIGPAGYYEGDRAAALDVEVPQRPSPVYVWNGSAWAVDPALQAFATRLGLDLADLNSAKLDSTILTLVNQDKAAWIAWVTANLSFCVATADRNRLGTIFWVISVSVRGLLRQPA
jgi:hypothetical protein